MPIFARRPAVALTESGEVIAVLSESAQRVRGQTALLDPVSKEKLLICYETPHRNERLGWLFSTFQNSVGSSPVITPIFVRSVDDLGSANPTTAHYLRHAQGLELSYFPTSKKCTVYFWWNLFSPSTTLGTSVSCSPSQMLPNVVSVNGDWAVYQDVGGTPLQAINKSVDQFASATLSNGPGGKPIAGLYGRRGSLTVTLGAGGTPAGMGWTGASIRVVFARREVAQEDRVALGLPLTRSRSPFYGISDNLTGPFRDGNPQATVTLQGTFNIGSESLPVVWSFIPANSNSNILTVFSNANSFQSALNPLLTYYASVRFQNIHKEITAQLALTVSIDNLFTPLDPVNQDGFTSLYFVALDATLQCFNVVQTQVETFLSTYKNIPISYTDPIDPYEPHAFQRTNADPTFNYSVGDPPLDPGGAWAGVYNLLATGSLLLVGGTAIGKNQDPFQYTDAHESLPSTPGYVSTSEVQTEGALITLDAITDFIDEHTEHLYHQREIQAASMSSRVLMMATGSIENLILQEQPPDEDDTNIPQFGSLIIGSGDLSPAVIGEQYVGINFVTIQNTLILYPFGIALPGFATSLPGDQGHQFKVSGGQAPYTWCLRRTRSSANDPAREPTIPPGPAPSNYPFDNFGNLVSPEPTFPPAVQGGGLPPGMLLDQGGFFYGTPTQSGTFLFRLHVKDANGLRGEQTVRFIVMQTDIDILPCSQPRVTPVTYKTTISHSILDSVPDSTSASTWQGEVVAIGGQTGKYLFTFPNAINPPNQSVPVSGSSRVLSIGVGTGKLSLVGITSSNFSTYMGVWLFEVQAIEVLPAGVTGPTCDIQGVSLSIGTTVVAGIADPTATSSGIPIPEGPYQATVSVRPYLILDPPKVVKSFIQGKNTYLQGSPGFPLRPDLGGASLDPIIITSVNPGTANPVQVIGVGVEEPAPSHYYLDWLHSNPVTYFRDIVDRFDPVPVPPIPPSPPIPPGTGTPDITGDSIDEFLPVGKRIRPLWPV